MMFFLRKFFEMAALPLGLGVSLITLSLLFRRRLLGFAGVLVIWLAATPPVAVWLTGTLERRFPAQSPESAPQADAIVMLAGGIVRGVSATGIQWGDTANRFFGALDLYRAGRAPILVLTDGRGPENPQSIHGDLLRAEAIRRGVPADRIILTGRVLTTEDEARAIAAIPGIHRILLVTSAFHMRRSMMLFSAFGMEATAFPTDQRLFGVREEIPTNFLPNGGALRQTEDTLREYYGLAVYAALFAVHPPARPAVTVPSVPAAVSAPQ